jgi:hypothetical protein
VARLAVVLAAFVSGFLLLAAGSSGQVGADLRWQQIANAPGVLDIAGPRTDGRFVVATAGGLYLLHRDNSLAPFARPAGGYVPARGETYVALAQKRRVPGAGCSFRADAVFALDPVDHPGLTLIDPDGRARRFADLPSGTFLSSIAFDNVGSFGHRILVTAVVAGRTALYAIDCRGRARVVIRDAPRVEGGAAVSSKTFGRFPGRLIAADELTGRVYSFSAKGHVRLLVRPNLAAGSDIGVESVGFIPPGFTSRGGAYMADLGAPGSPTQGTDSILKLGGSALKRAGARPGDLILATEASGITIAVRCDRRCTVLRVGHALDATHAEGHIAFAAR